MRHFSLTLAFAAVALLAAGSARAQLGPVYSLDDNPAMPITSPLGPIPGFGAEDPYGIGLLPPPGLAPSPSLPAVVPFPAMDQDLLIPNVPGMPPVPLMHVPIPGPGWLDAVTDNAFKANPAPMIHLGFSVDRVSMGTAAGAVGMEAMCSQQSGDIYYTNLSFTHPAMFVGTPPLMPGYNGPLPTVGMGNSNLMLYDDSQLGLVAGSPPGVPTPPGVPVPPPFPGSHDNLDALNWKFLDTNGDFLHDRWMYLSTPPDGAMAGAWMPGDVLDLAPGAALFPAMPPYAPAGQLGLVPGPVQSDCIDALVVWDDGMQGGPAWGAGPGAEPMLDYALFSLAPGSVSLWQWGLSEADIFFTNFSGSFWLYASAADLGLMGVPGPAIGDNVDALEMMHPGDANLDYCVDGLDYVIWSNNYFPIGAPTGWLQGDFNGDGLTDGLDYVVWSNNYLFGCPAVPTAVPEPASALVLALGLFFVRRRRHAA